MAADRRARNDLPGLREALSALHQAAGWTATGEAALAVLAARGIPGARLWLDGEGGWVEPVRPEGSAHAADSSIVTEGLGRARAGDAITLEFPTEEGGGRWELVPIPGKGSPLGVLGAPSPPDSPIDRETLLTLASFLGAKGAQFRAERDLVRERDRNAGWFKTLDDQIRILEGERQKLAVLLNKTDAAIFVTDPDGTITWVNPVMLRRYPGPRGGGLVGLGCSAWCGQEEGCRDCPIRSVRDGVPLGHHERKEDREDGTRHLYVSAFPVRSPEGRVNAILTMVQDITDLETLRRSQARYQLLFERSTDAMVMARTDNLEIVMANRQARELFAISPGLQMSTNLLQLHPPRIRTGMKAHYARLQRGRALENLEVEVMAADGGTRTVNACGTLFDLDGSEAILVEFRDVTHLRELQAELARADHLITLGTMNAGIAHEFKNRLAPLRAFAQLLTKEEIHLPRVLAHAPLMIQEIDRLTSLVRDVLDYARPQEPDPAVEDLSALVGELAEEFRREFAEVLRTEGIRCEVIPEDERYPVWIDAAQLRRAFLNLFKNAVEAMEGWTGERVLRIGVRQEGESAILFLHDTGRGIDATTLARVFDPFYTTKGPKGTGLGMCITRSLIEANGGTVLVASAPGRGTQVTLVFPLAGRALAPSPPEGRDSPADPPPPPDDDRRAA